NRVGTPENNVLEEIKPEPGETVINKTTIGAFSSTNLDSILWTRDLRYLLFTGVSTNMCVESTAREAADRGFRCVLIDDACGASKTEYHEATLVTFQRLFGKVRSSEEVMKELRAKLGSQAFG
ncbi:MAG TPA: cysteine hydrolase, partial [Acidobacteriota bacterium]|nr:cysteine hydrolase [Acidobacteriota bacterium]